MSRLPTAAAGALLAATSIPLGGAAQAHELHPDGSTWLGRVGGAGRPVAAMALTAVALVGVGMWARARRRRTASRAQRRTPARPAMVMLGGVLALVVATALPPVGPRTPAAAADPSLVGLWSPPFDLAVKGIHVIVLPNGKGVLFSYPDNTTGSKAVIWNPITGGSRDVSLTHERDIFCTAHSHLADGRVFLPGGHLYEGDYGDGVKESEFYDPWTEAWSAGPLLTAERWYPTSVQLGDGRVLIFGGTKAKGLPVDTAESFDPATNTIVQLPDSATKRTNSYPRMHLLPTGRVALVNQKRTELFDPLTNTWSYVNDMNFGGRGQKSNSVLLPDLDRVLQIGGENETNGVTATAEIIDFSQPEPQWRYTASMAYPRIYANAVLLPDGTVLEVGGGGGGGLYANPVPYAELFDPVTETWRVMAAQQAPRVYHSTAVLLPDGRVLSAGHDSGSYQYAVEIYSPPYLFKGARPSVNSAPATVGYGQQFTISTRDASSVSRVALVRPDSVTHSTNFDQRQVNLGFTATDATTLTASSPAGPDHAPPGWYMLFILNAKGVPSVASWVQVGVTPDQKPAPAITGFDPISGSAGTTVAITGSGFNGATGVTFNGTSSAYAVDSDTSLSAAVPFGATTGPITVTTAGGTATSATDFTVTQPYRDVVLADGPVGYWRLGETTGDAVDETGNAAGGTYIGEVTRGVPGALAGDPDLAARFDGTDDYVGVPDHSLLTVGDVFTYELWVKRGAAQGANQRLLHKGAGPAALGLNRQDKVVLVTGSTTVASSKIKITDQNWHHIVATKNGPDVHLYVDGVDVTRSGSSATMTSNTTDLNIGRATNASRYFDGDLDEVAIYPVALTAEQVSAHYKAGAP